MALETVEAWAAIHAGGITIDITVTASQCTTLAKGGRITLKDETLEFKKGIKRTVVKQKDFDDNGTDLSKKYRNECDSYGWVNRKTFEGSWLYANWEPLYVPQYRW